MGDWKGELLSQAARLLLIQSVTTSIPAYVMNSCKIPMKIVEALERANRRFLWGDTDQQNSLHSVAWSTVCKPKNIGGLGLRPTADMNKVLLAKLTWRLLSTPNSLWAKVLTTKYGQLDAANPTNNKTSKSIVWRGLLFGFCLLSQRLRQDEEEGNMEEFNCVSR